MAKGFNINKKFFSKFFPTKGVDSDKVNDQALHINHFDLQLQANNTQVVSYEYDAGNSKTALTVNFNLAVNQKISLNTTSPIVFTFSNGINARAYLLKFVHTLVGAKSITWPVNVKWQYNVTPSLSTTLNAIDLISFYYDGTNYFGSTSIGY